MRNLNFNDLPNDYHLLYARKIYNEMINEKIQYDNKTIDDTINIFIKTEEYEKCHDLKNKKIRI